MEAGLGKAGISSVQAGLGMAAGTKVSDFTLRGLGTSFRTIGVARVAAATAPSADAGARLSLLPTDISLTGLLALGDDPGSGVVGADGSKVSA